MQADERGTEVECLNFNLLTINKTTNYSKLFLNISYNKSISHVKPYFLWKKWKYITNFHLIVLAYRVLKLNSEARFKSILDGTCNEGSAQKYTVDSRYPDFAYLE